MISLHFNRQMLFVLVAAALASLLTSLAAAQEKAEMTLRSQNGKVTEYATEPLLHEPSGSYLQYVTCRGVAPCYRWQDAMVAATRRVYQGRRGRLAKLDSVDAHIFVVSNFEFEKPTWFGLRYICRGRALIWSDGARFERTFAAWDRRWNAVDDACRSNVSYMGVFYWPQSQRWRAIGPGKGWFGYIVEYPQPSE